MTRTTESSAGSGIGIAFARERLRAVRRLAYALTLELPAAPDCAIEGRVAIELELAPGAGPPAIDFAPCSEDEASRAHVRAVRINGVATAFALVDGHIQLAGPCEQGPQRIEIDFVAGEIGLTRREGLVYSLFVPARAHSVFPCFDQPDLKAPLELCLTVPDGWSAMANAPEIARVRRRERVSIRFARTEPLPTYLFAWCAGRLEIEERSVRGRVLRIAHLERDVSKLEANRAAILELHAAALDLLEDYTGIRYPFAQFGFVLIPDFQFGGMEHAGAVFYRRELLLLGEDASDTERLKRANLIAHETAHMWFGDLVTMPWFDDVWLKEVFANFMAGKVTERSFPQTDHRLGFVLQHYPAAYAIDRTKGAHPIRQSLENLSEAGELYDALIYHKAPIAMDALEQAAGADALRASVRAYLDAHRFANADWPAFVAHLRHETDIDIDAFGRAWIESSGLPERRTDGIDWDRPQYGRFDLDDADRTAALDIVESDGPDDADRSKVRRAHAWLALYEDMQGGGIAPTRLLAAAIARLSTEPEPLIAARMAVDATELYWRFLTVPQRGAAAAAFERVAKARLDTSRNHEHALLWLKRWIDVALGPESLAELAELAASMTFRSRSLPEGLATHLVLRLGLHRHEQADELIAAQARRIADADRRARLEFVAPALSAERAERDALFERLVAGAGRELWAVSALGWLNDALRADAALCYLEPGIEHAARLRQRGHIFLPRQWLDALFRGHGSPAAAALVTELLATSGREYAPRMRQLILQTADPVFRAAASKQAAGALF